MSNKKSNGSQNHCLEDLEHNSNGSTLLAMNDSFPLANADDSEGENPLRSISLEFLACCIKKIYLFVMFHSRFNIIVINEYLFFHLMLVSNGT